ncbi:MAG: HK97 family phage prohead protease [Pseudomonadota bacterium]
MNDTEYRMSSWYAGAKPSVRAEGECTQVAGIATVFDQRSVPLGGFVEVIHRDAFANCDMDGAVCAANHDYTAAGLLGRAGINHDLEVSDAGLEYLCTPAEDNAAWRTYMPLLRDRQIFQSSFAFRVAPGGSQWDEDDDGVIVRTVMSISRLYDTAPVTFPAYTQTTSEARSGAAQLSPAQCYPERLEHARRGLDQALGELRDHNDLYKGAMERRAAYLASIGA